MRILKISALGLALFYPSVLPAQVDTAALERLHALSETDPELYQLIMMLLDAKRREVEGGFDWESTSADLDCTEAFNGGFSECEATVILEGKSFAPTQDRRNASLEIECEVVLRTETEDGFSSTDRESQSGELAFYSGSRASAEQSVDFRFIGVSRVVSAVIGDVSCELTGVR